MCENQALAPYQKSLVTKISEGFECADLDDGLLGVLVVGMPGSGVSTCIREYLRCIAKNFIVVDSLDLVLGLSLGQWLGQAFGFDAESKSLKVKASPSLIKILEIARIEILLIEDAHDLNRLDRPIPMLERTIEEFVKLKESIPKLKLLMTFSSLNMSGRFCSEDSPKESFIVVRASHFSCDDLNFLWRSLHLDSPFDCTVPVLSDRVFECIHQFSKGSVGRALFVMGLIKKACLDGSLFAEDDCIMRFVSVLEGESND